jgi:competence protein ComEA
MLNLTRQERQVILFLIVVALLGLGINFLLKHHSKIKIIAYVSQDIAKIDINKAGKQSFMDVPGVGKILAQRIIDYRKQNAGFEVIAELKSIKGISKPKYEAIKDYFIVE